VQVSQKITQSFKPDSLDFGTLRTMTVTDTGRQLKKSSQAFYCWFFFRPQSVHALCFNHHCEGDVEIRLCACEKLLGERLRYRWILSTDYQGLSGVGNAASLAVALICKCGFTFSTGGKSWFQTRGRLFVAEGTWGGNSGLNRERTELVIEALDRAQKWRISSIINYHSVSANL